MKKIMTLLAITAGSILNSHADIGLLGSITYTNHNFIAGPSDASFPLGGEADVTITVENTNTGIVANSVWVYLKFPLQQFWQPHHVVSIPAGFALVDSLNSGNETILVFENISDLPTPVGLPNVYNFVVRGVAVGTSAGYAGTGIFQGNFANMEYANGVMLPGVSIQPTSISPGLTKNAEVLNVPLPVTLLDFTASKKDRTSLLSWATASEKNNLGFEIERSSDGKTFGNIGFQKSLAVDGNSQEKLSYSFTDLVPRSGANYYRLKQTDRDGAFTYSNVVMLNFDNNGDVNLAVYPNPASEEVKVTADDLKNIRIYDGLGRAIQAPVLFNNGGGTVQTQGLASGIYSLHIETATSTERVKVVIQH